MTHSSRWLLVTSVFVVACCATTGLYAQDDLEALLQQNLGGQQKQPAAVAPKEAAPAPAEKPAEPAVAPAAEAAPAPAEMPAEPAVAPAAEAAPAPAEMPAEPAVAPAAAAAPAPAEMPAVPAAAPTAAVEPEPAPTPAAAEADTGDQSSLVSELLTLEKIRRQSLDDHGYASLDVARKALRDGDYPLAREQFKQAMEFIGNRPANQAARQEATVGMAEAYYRDAKLAMKQGDIEKALPLAGQAQERGHPQAARLLEALKQPITKEEADTASVSHRVDEADYKEDRDGIRKRLRRSRQFYTTAEYDKALEECELVLRDNPHDTEAMELRKRIGDRMKTVADIEFDASRSLMIKDVRKTWTPERYAIDSAQLPNRGGDVTSKAKVATGSKGQTDEQMVNKKLKEIVIPEVSFRPPATIIDAVDFFKQASRDYDNPEIPVEQRGVNIVLKLATTTTSAPAAEAAPADPFAPAASPSAGGGVPVISALSARFINLYDALKLVCDVTGMKFRIRGNIVMIVPLNDPESELITRSYNVLESLVERQKATLGDLGAAGGGGAGESTFMTTSDMSGKEDWKTFFQQLGVVWPDGSSISYMSSIGKIRVTNTAEQLAVFEQALEDLNVTPRLIEIEARFVEVSQKDLNSLGFEWLLNSDFSFDTGGFLDKVLNLQEYSSERIQLTDTAGNLLYESDGVTPLYGYSSYQTVSSASGTTGYRHNSDGTLSAVSASSDQYTLVDSATHNMGVNAVDGSTYSTGTRYLSTTGNPISGEGNSTNDQFMKINAFLGNADLSLILHMLSQRSDTDLLSAPKVVTKSGQEAVMKVVTEYIYPTEFEVTGLQSGSGVSGGGSTTTGAVVEPQNFEMREVGIILQVVPEVSAEGQMINLMLNPQVVSEPVWKNYGAKIPIQKTSSITANITGLSAADLSSLLNPEPEYMELPMEQPFFHVRSVQTQLSIYNGATVVMGGLITESRKTIEDKVPFLGDLPFLGRLFRSRSEESDKRNLLVFVTARLVDPAGRTVRMSSGGESSLMSGAGQTSQQQEQVVASPTSSPVATP